MDFQTGAAKPEAELHNRTLGKMPGRIDKHAVGTDIRWARRDLLGAALVGQREVAELSIAGRTPFAGIVFLRFSRVHGSRAPSRSSLGVSGCVLERRSPQKGQN